MDSAKPMTQTGKTEPNSVIHSVAGLGAVVRPGVDLMKIGTKCGDSILIDFDCGFFAVADSPDRSPNASRDFLSQFSEMLNDFRPGASPTDDRTDAAGEAADSLLERTNRLIASIAYNENTTFTGIQIFQNEERKQALLLHCGDSLMYHLRIHEHKAEKISENNHYFVGRTDKVYQILLFDYYDDSRFLLATDGFLDIRKNSGPIKEHCLPEKLMETLTSESMDQLPEVLLNRFDLFPEPCDDLGLITLDPNQCFPALGSRIM